MAEPGNIMALPNIARCLRVFIATVALISVTSIFVLIPAVMPPQSTSWTIQQDLDIEQLTITTVPTTPLVPLPSTDDFERLIDLHSFKFIKNVDPMTCNNQTFLIFIHSAPENVEKRTAIRDTWGANTNLSIKVLFMLGFTSNQAVQQVLNEEQEKYNDIVQGNFIDKYRNITYKHVMALKWIYYFCNQTEFVLKTDDDVFINMPKLIHSLLPTLPSSKLIFCDVTYNARVKRTWRSKWRVSFNEFAASVYPDYCAGWAVLYSMDVAQQLYIEAQKYRFFWVDDVHITGIIAKRLKIKHFPSKNWTLTEEKTAKQIISNKKWPSGTSYIFGPYDASPVIIRRLWNILLTT